MKITRWICFGLALPLVAILASPRAVMAQTIIEEWDSVKAPPAPPLKPVTIDAKSTGLLMMDFNRNSCLPDRRPRCANALPKLKKLLADARAHGMPVVHTLTNEKATVADISPELAPVPGEPVLTPGLDKFVTGEIAKYFKDKGVTTVILAGTSANGAVLFTVGGAVVAGFKAIVPVDGMPAETPYQEQFSVWNIAYGPRLREGATLTKMDMIKF